LEPDTNRNDFDAAMAGQALNNLKNAVMRQSVGNYSKSYETWRRVSNVVGSFKEELSSRKKAELRTLIFFRIDSILSSIQMLLSILSLQKNLCDLYSEQ
jgi:hypothetical protein